MKVALVTLFPEFFASPLRASILGRAVARGILSVDLFDPRDFAPPPHYTVDDTPYGGGPGMVLRVDVMHAALDAARRATPGAPALLLSPRGPRLTQARLAELSRGDLILLCGHYEEVDERLRRHLDGELSVGDFVLSGGEPAALCAVDGLARLLEGALGNAESARAESFCAARLDHPHYTRPRVYRGDAVPEPLLSGDHKKIARFRAARALALTLAHRPDLLAGGLTPEERDMIDALADGKPKR